MNTLNSIKGFINKLLLVLSSILLGILIAFTVHVFQINRYNNTKRTISGESASAEVTADIHPRGLITDSWEKNDAFEDKVINAKIYEGTVVNSSQTLLTRWDMRINIKESCYLNNAWNGTVEVHQMHGEKEAVQLLDLRNYDVNEITVDYYLAGQDLLIPLENGDYIIYYPDDSKSSFEMPLKSSREYAGEANIGIIFYSLTGDVELSDYEVSYYLKKSYFEGMTGKFFMFIIPFWTLFTILCYIIATIVLRFEGRIYLQSKLIDEIFELCATVADSKDYYHKEHSIRVARYSKMLAEHMGMDKSDCDTVYYATLLRNVGNCVVPERILGKSGELAEDEYKIVQTHTVKGSQLLEKVESLPYVMEAARYHHERYDGTGYPSGLKGDEIPLIARIIAVADAYDEMNHDRDYRKKLEKDKIRQEFIDNKGLQFDPIVVDEFLEIMDKLKD